ncbi:1-phosphofructokinase family hexose kinase [Protaetiibacter mangrovi]|uniref:PfkB family carbohydrate kinase n=1 Tax=Protaetiibacter mangrovi TaxID=2970926 RepID=A0ABT1ZCY2_9MICO|nr:PfkB family carbohydrate kinase [Protaetiibacter mangrovi]MCS0498541.1 PfkB family carbohydrate kinase [Protaetiibacter mangrovi]
MITCLGLSPALDVTYGVGALVVGGIHRPQWTLALPGGKSLNVARAVRALGGEARAIAPLGGRRGAGIADALAADGVELVVVPTREETRMCVSVVDAATGEITEIYEHPRELPDASWHGVADAVEGVGSGWLAVSGSVPAARAAALGELLADAEARGVRLALDLRGEALAETLARTRPALVKINRAEAEETVGPGPLASLAAGLRARGAAVAVVTDGASGSLGADASGAWRVTSPPAGSYTVGAGDSFLAGLLLAIDSGRPLPEALRAAAAVAAANTLRPGAAVWDAGQLPRLADGLRVEPAPGASRA